MHKTVVIIPAFNEENAVGKVISEIPEQLVNEILVVNNNSTDATSERAKKAGATVIEERSQGYGNACLKGIEYYRNKKEKPDIVVFLDADYSDYPAEMEKLVQPIKDGSMDLVVGSRALGGRQKGSMTRPQIIGNWLATRLLKLFYGVRFTDLGPFRAISWKALMDIDMKDKTYGWTVEMQLKAAKKGLNTCEVPVNYRPRVGFSKISGTIKGSVMAGYKILVTIFKYL